MFSYVFYYRYMNIGGCQLLIKKLADEIVNRGDRAYIYCESITQKLAVNPNKIKVIQINHGKWGDNNKLIEFLKTFTDKNIRNITFTWEDYAWVYSCAEFPNQVLLYAVHHDILKMAACSNYAILERLRKRYLAPIIFKLITNKSIAMMDEQTIQHTLSYYGFTDIKPQIIRIPIFFESKDLNLAEIAKKYNQKHKIILAVARADFPFKGYLIGLIELMKKNKIPKEFTLSIVSYGPNYDELISVFEQCPNSVKDRIRLYGEKPYDDLIELFEKSHIYVGMGTTLLDASKYGVISIPVVSYSYQVKCKHFFHQNYNMLALDDGTEQRFLELLNEINLLKEDSALPILIDCEKRVKQIYSVEKCVDEIDGLFRKMKGKRIRMINLYYKVKKITNNLRSK